MSLSRGMDTFTQWNTMNALDLHVWQIPPKRYSIPFLKKANRTVVYVSKNVL